MDGLIQIINILSGKSQGNIVIICTVTKDPTSPTSPSNDRRHHNVMTSKGGLPRSLRRSSQTQTTAAGAARASM